MYQVCIFWLFWSLTFSNSCLQISSTPTFWTYFNCTAKSVSSVSSSHSSDHNGCAVSPPTGFIYCDCDSASVQSTRQRHPSRYLARGVGRDTFDGEVFEFVVFF